MSRKKNVESPVLNHANVQHTYSKGGFKLQTAWDKIRTAHLSDENYLNAMPLDSSQIDTIITLLTAWKEAIEDGQ